MALVLIQLFQRFWLKSRIFALTNSIQKFIGLLLPTSLWKIGHLTEISENKTLELIKKGADPILVGNRFKGFEAKAKVLG